MCSLGEMKLALAQMLVEPGRKQANLDRAAQHIAEATEAGADCVLLPEALNLGWTHPSARTEADAIPDGESCRQLRDAARAHSVFVCAGLVERYGESIFNSAVLIDPAGNVILHHRKIHELDIAHDLYARGDRLGVVDTSLGRIGLMICADAFAPVQPISRALGLMGARLILSPCAWAVPADHDNVREPYGALWLENYVPVARDFNLTIAGASNVGPITEGPWRGRKCIGNSLVVGPSGEELARGPYGENADALMLIDLPCHLQAGG
jgi:predicted amidohydrolase